MWVRLRATANAGASVRNDPACWTLRDPSCRSLRAGFLERRDTVRIRTSHVPRDDHADDEPCRTTRELESVTRSVLMRQARARVRHADPLLHRHEGLLGQADAV